YLSSFSFDHPPTTAIYTLSLHDALPICHLPPALALTAQCRSVRRVALLIFARIRQLTLDGLTFDGRTLELAQYELLSVADSSQRSEEHTSELQSRENLVCRLLLEKKKKK